MFRGWSVCVYLCDSFRDKNEIHGSFATENVNQSSVNNEPHKETSCVCKNQALDMRTVIAILLLMLCMKERLSTKNHTNWHPKGHALCCLPLSC